MRQTALLAAFAVLLAGTASAETVSLSVGFAPPPYQTEQAFRTIKIGNPRILDVQAMSDHTVLFQPIAVGATNVLFLDASGDTMREVTVYITGQAPGTMQIIKPGEGGMASMLYRCADKQGCEFVGTGQIPVQTVFPTRSSPTVSAPQENSSPVGPPSFQVPSR